MRFQPTGDEADKAVGFSATAFRDNKSAALVKITSFSFDRCEFSSTVTLATGEQLRLHIPGQGWIKVEVESSDSGKSRARFVTEADV